MPIRSFRFLLPLLLLCGRAGAELSAEPVRLDAGAAGLRILAAAGEKPISCRLSFRANRADGKLAFATGGCTLQPAAAGQPVGAVFALEGPAAKDASVRARIEPRPGYTVISWQIEYHGPAMEFNGWTTGFSTEYSPKPASAATDTPICWRQPDGSRENEVAGDTPYPDFQWQMRRARWSDGREAVIAADWYDPDWIYKGETGRAAFHHCSLPKAAPATVTRRMAIFFPSQAGEPGTYFAAAAAGQPAALAVSTPQGFLFAPGEPVTFTLRARQTAPSAAPCRLSWEVWDYYGERVAHGEEALASTADRWREIPVRIEYPKRGILFLDARLRWPGGESVYRDSFGVLPKRPLTAPQPDSPFGLAAIIANPETYPDQPALETVLPLAQRIGARWLRGGWFPLKAEVSPEEEKAVRARAALLQRYGFSLHTQLGSRLPEAGKEDAFREELRASLARFGDLSRHIEVGNELNFSIKAPDYTARLLRPAAAATRAACPGAQVMSMGLGGVDRDWVAALEAAGGLDLVDILSIHPGCHPRAPENYNGWRGWFFPSQVADAVAAARRHGKAVWITEAYAPTPPEAHGIDLRTSADYLVRTYALSLALGVRVIEWYQFQDGTWFARRPNPADTEYSYGIVTTDLHPKPAYLAYGVMTEKLEGARCDGRLDLGADDLYGIRFTRAGQPVDVLWSYREKSDTDRGWYPPERYRGLGRHPGEPWRNRWVEPVRLRLPAAAPVRVTDSMGNTTECRPEKGAITLELTGSPLFVEGLGKIPIRKNVWQWPYEE